MTDFVVGFMRETLSNRVVMCRKSKPKWQAGLLNGIGGKINPAVVYPNGPTMLPETPLSAMRREWWEEVGFENDSWRLFCILRDDGRDIEKGCTIYCFASQMRMLPNIRATTDVGDNIEYVHLHNVLSRTDIVSQIKWMLPLAFLDEEAPLLEVNTPA